MNRYILRVTGFSNLSQKQSEWNSTMVRSGLQRNAIRWIRILLT